MDVRTLAWQGEAKWPRAWLVRACLAAAIASCAVIAAADSADAAPGRVFQLNATKGCTSGSGTEGCATGRNLKDASATAVSPDGRNVYVAAPGSSAVTTFVRNPRNGSAVQLKSLSGCISETGQGKCLLRRGLHGATSVAVSPDGRNVYVASLDSVAAFARVGARKPLRPLPGSLGCVSQVLTPGCGLARGIDTTASIAVSPDGKNVYVTGFYSNTVAVFARDPGTGGLIQLPGANGCISNTGAEGCSTGRALAGAWGLAFDSSGTRLYVASSEADAVAVLIRNPSDGTLTQLAGEAGCASAEGLYGCSPARGLNGVKGVAVEGENVYSVASGSDALAAFRVGGDGVLRQPAGTAGCLAEGGAEGCRRDDALNSAFAVIASPDGRNVYVGSDLAVSAFRRRPDGGVPRPVGCTSDHGLVGCSAGRALNGVTSIAMNPRGKHAYVTAEESDSLSVFARDPQHGFVQVKMREPRRGCISHNFNTHLKVKSTLPLRRVRVFVDGTRRYRRAEPPPVLRIDHGDLPKGRHSLKVTAVDVTGTSDKKTMPLRRC